jgi:hypothetical protein
VNDVEEAERQIVAQRSVRILVAEQRVRCRGGRSEQQARDADCERRRDVAATKLARSGNRRPIMPESPRVE